ncbi:EAL domain-containing protein [Nitrosomonas sp.]|uniref:EAL domain-containing protein n=1 Tax=Nitrosomonas sp. TaxID=42353 RepID=UPI00260A0D01|nr:EAL domain-containing protein [Nitrosomonas sp.]
MTRLASGFWNTFAFRSSLLLLGVVLLVLMGWLERFDWMIYDKISHWRQFSPDNQIVIVAIDEKSLQAIGRWPWSRRVHAELINRLTHAGRNVIAFDLLLSEPDEQDPEGDRLLSHAIAAHGAVVLPIAPVVDSNSQQLSLIQPLELFRRKAMLGHVDIELDRDGVVRRIFLMAGINAPDWPALGLLLARKAGLLSAQNKVVHTIGNNINPSMAGRFWVRSHETLIPFAGPQGTYPQISYEQILRNDSSLEELSGKIVIVGMTAIGLQQGFTTPVTFDHRLMSGVEWHANVVDMLRNGRMIHPVSDFIVVVFTVTWVWMALWGISRISRNFVILWLMTVLFSGGVLISIAFKLFHIWLPPSGGILGILAVYPLWNWRRINEFMRSHIITKAYSHAALESVSEGVITTDAQNRIIYMNREAERILCTTCQRVQGKVVQQVLDVEGLKQSGLRSGQQTSMRDDEPNIRGIYHSLRTDNGLERTVRVSHQLLSDENNLPIGAVITIADITDTIALKQRVAHQAHHDIVTTLPNRTSFLTKLDQVANSAKQTGFTFAIFFVAIDNFRKINDALGHQAGDVLLRMIAQRLLAMIREEDIIARWGGDEFVLLFGQIQNETTASQMAQKILETINHPFGLNGHDVFVTASIGVSLYPQDSKVSELVLNHAMSAMSLIKQQGGNQFCSYSPELITDWTRDKLEFEKDFRLALKNEALQVFFQPIVDVRSGHIVRMEALARWKHPDRGYISPAEFIPLAERIGLIAPLGEFVLRRACEVAADFAKANQSIGVSVNVAPRQLLHKDFIATIERVMRDTGLPASLLILEITESAVVSDMVRAAELLTHLKALGVSIALDDFGTGYSSLSLLRELPIDILKIDKSFIRTIEHNTSDFTISHAIIGLGKNLGMAVIAEGVETVQHMQILREQGCFLHQGYYFSRPVPIAEFWSLIDGGDSKILSLCCAAIESDLEQKTS